MIVILICLVVQNTNLSNQNRIIQDQDTTFLLQIPEIQIDKKTYTKMVDIVTDYSLLAQDHDEKMILIYLSTFHLFDMNYGNLSIKKLDDRIEKYPYFPNNTLFPEGNMHHALQKAIITHITLQITNSERRLLHDREKDRVIIDIYLSNLFTGIGIMK